MAVTMKTQFPFENSVSATVTAASPTHANLRIRVPSWASREMTVSVNGKAAKTGRPGSYLPMQREWTTGDVIEFTLPTSIRVKRYEGDDQAVGKTRYSIEYGPILLAIVGSPKVDLTIDKGQLADHLANHLEPVAGSPLHFTVRGNPGQTLMPYWQISEEEFTCYPSITAMA
jgi:DUF1680 family protein